MRRAADALAQPMDFHVTSATPLPLQLACPCNRTFLGHGAIDRRLQQSSAPAAPLHRLRRLCLPSARRMPERVRPAQHAEAVVTFCSEPLDWLPNALAEAEAATGIWFARVTVYSKCGRTAKLATLPEGWEIRVLPNIGRNDHTWVCNVARPSARLLILKRKACLLYNRRTTWAPSMPASSRWSSS